MAEDKTTLLRIAILLVVIALGSMLISAPSKDHSGILNKYNFSLGEKVIINTTFPEPNIELSILFQNNSYNYTNNTIINKDSYVSGEIVIIYAGSFDNIEEILITNNQDNYRFIGSPAKELTFSPPAVGNYTITIKTNSTAYSKNFTVISVEAEKILISTDKKEYYVGDPAVIYFNLTPKENYTLLIISETGIFQYLGIPSSPLKFLPNDIGEYRIELREKNIVLASSIFYVKSKEIARPEFKIYTDKKEYNLGENVTIYSKGNITEFKILYEDEIFRFLWPIEEIVFSPRNPGIYKIIAFSPQKNQTKEIDFHVKTKESYDYSFSINKDVFITVDFSAQIKSKKTLIDKIFGLSPIKEVKAYIENYTENKNFNLTLEKLGKNKFRIRIKSNPNIKPSAYLLVIEVMLHEEIIREERAFLWGSTLKIKIENITAPLVNKTKLTNATKYIEHYFTLNEKPLFIVDFTGIVKKPRNILDAALKKPSVEKISAYIEGEEKNDDFRINIAHLGLDKFSIEILNKNPEEDIYKLIVVAKADNKFFAKQILFDWGVENISKLIKRIEIKNKTTTLAEIVRITGINITQRAIKNITQLNKTVNKSLINLSTKLISESEKNISSLSNLTNVSLVRELNLSIKNSRDEKIHFQIEINDKYDVTVLPEAQPIKKIFFKGLEVQENQILELKLDKIKKEKIRLKNTKKAFAINPENLSFTEAVVTAAAEGTELWKCKEWNFSEQECYGNWTKIMDLIPGKEYNFTLTAEDPGYAETGLASINTKKSLYHPGETAEIIMVVLDTEGHLVSEVNITLTIISPNDSIYSYTSLNNEIIETETGIYEINFPYTNLEGNYLMTVSTSGDKVNSTMLSYFTVKKYYEFDILRQIPVTTDPWQGAFSSSIKIISYTNSSIFNFSEVLPINFTINNSGGAIIREENDKKILTWTNLNNNSIVSYSALPPLITPELYELTSFVTYDKNFVLQNFFEARPWYLAVDPARFTVVRRVYNISSCTTLVCNQTSGTQIGGDYSDGDTILLPTDSIYRMEIRVTQTGNNQDWTISATISDTGLPTNLIVTADADNIWDDISVSEGSASDDDTGDGGSFSSGTLTWNPASGQAFSGNDRNQIAIFYYIMNPTDVTDETSSITFDGTPNADSIQIQNTIDWVIVDDPPYLDPGVSPNPAKNDSSIFQNDVLTFNATWLDDKGLSGYIFSWNDSDQWVNSSFYAFSGLTNVSVNTSQVSSPAGETVGWRFYANDTRSQWTATAIQTFTVASAADTAPPLITNPAVSPASGLSGTDFNISATITDNTEVVEALAEITYPNSTKVNYSMTDSGTGNVWYYVFTGYSGGNYSSVIFARDGNNNWNDTFDSPVYFNVTANISTERIYYDKGDTVIISGSGFSANVNVTINIFGQTTISGYPQNTTTDSNGDFTHNLALPSGSSFVLGNYTITANDTLLEWLNDDTDIVVVLLPLYAKKFDDVDSGADVLGFVNVSDDNRTTIETDAAQEDYIELNWTNNYAQGYDIINATVYIEYITIGAWDFGLDWFNGTDWVDICTIPASLTEDTASCSIIGIDTIAEANDIALRITDNNLLNNKDIEIDFVYFMINATLSTEMTVIINEPAYSTSTYDYTDTVNNKAYDGMNQSKPPLNITMGTEATAQEYTNLSISNNTYYTTTITTNGYYPVQSFNFKVVESINTIYRLTLLYEGYVMHGVIPAPDNFSIRMWNYTSERYQLVSNETSSASDKNLSFEYSSGFDDLIDSQGNVWILVQAQSIVTFGSDLRGDIYTDYIKLDVTTYPTIKGNQLINVSALDADGVASCTYRFRNSSYNYSWIGMDNETTPDETLWTNTSDTLLYNDGFYYINANCTDNLGNYNADEEVYVRIDNNGPTVNLIAPFNNSNSSSANITFSWNASDLSGGNLNCNLTIDGLINNSNPIITQIDVQKNYTVNGLSEGTHSWNVSCWDSVDNIDYSNTWYFRIDLTEPAITLHFPSAEYWANVDDILFNYTPSDSYGIANCSLTLDGAINSTNTSINNAGFNYFTVENLSQGRHSWMINCTDHSGNMGNSSLINFTVDLEEPSINLSYPENGDNLTTADIQFNFTVTDNLDTNLTCNLTLDGNINNSIPFNANNGTITNYSVSNLAGGSHIWNVTCWDNASNINTSVTWQFTVDAAPTITLNFPQDNYWSSSVNITFNYTASDDFGISNCSIIIDGIVNQTNQSAISIGAPNYFNVSQIPQGMHTWSINCTDTGGNIAGSSTYNFTVDTDNPTVSLIAPQSGLVMETTSVDFNFTVIDNVDENLNCNLTLNNVNYGIIDAANGTNITYTIGSLAQDTYFWNVTCWDNASNINTSETWNFTLIGAPSITLNFPPQDYWSSMANITFEYTPVDSGDILNCTLILDGSANKTNETAISNGAPNYFNVSGIQQGLHNWSINCTDDQNQVGSSATWNFTIDTENPIINWTEDNPDPVNENELINITAGVTDNLEVNTVLVSINGTNYTMQHIYEFSIETADDNGTSGIYIGSGGNYTNTTAQDSSYYYVVDPDSGGAYGIAGNITLNFDASSVQKYTIYSINGTLTYCHSNENLNCDGGYRYGGTAYPMNIYILNASSGTWIDVGNIANMTDNTKTNATWNATGTLTDYINSSGWISLKYEFNINSGTGGEKSSFLIDYATLVIKKEVWNYTFNTTGLAPGVHNYTVYANDSAGSSAAPVTGNFTILDTVPPTIILNFPGQDYWSSTANISFNFTPSDSSTIANCTVILDGIINTTNQTAISNGAPNYINISEIPQGQHNWSVNCTDTDKNIGSSSTYSFIVDTQEPSINLSAPQKNASFLNGSYVELNFTVFDNLDNELMCNITLNGIVNNTSPINTGNSSIYTHPLTNLADNTYFWNVTCWDNASNINTSVTWNFTIASPPRIIPNFPGPDYWSNSANITFNYTPVDSGSIINCSIILDGIQNKSNETAISNGLPNYFNVSEISQGLHNWRIECTDEQDNIGVSETRNFSVDIELPLINLSAPDNGDTFFTGSVIEFNFTAFDNIDQDLLCNLTIDSIVNVSNIPAANGTLINYSVAGLSTTTHYWNVTCWDEASNVNTSVTRSFTISGAPGVFVEQPPDMAGDSDGNVTFTYTVDSAISLANCSLIINSKINLTNTSYVNYSNEFDNVFNLTISSEQKLYWTVNCTDSNGYTGNGSVRTLYIDFTPPSVNLSYPLPNETIQANYIDFNFTAIDNLAENLTCNLTVDSVVNRSGLNVENNVTFIERVYNFSAGPHNWSVTCWDYAGLVNWSETRIFNMSYLPKVTPIFPPADYWSNNATINFTYIPNDNSPTLQYCQLLIDDTIIKQETFPKSGELYGLANISSEGNHSWNISCRDMDNNDIQSPLRYYMVDLHAPTINLSYPNGTVFINTTIEFNFTAFDNFDRDLVCNITIDNVVMDRDIAVTNGTMINRTIDTGAGEGIHYWNVTCMDEAANRNTSATFNFTINTPPTVSLFTPPDNHWNTSENITFYYNISDLSGIANCSLIFDSKINKTNTSTIIIDGKNNFTLYNITEGRHTWTINCTDSTGLKGTDNERIIYIDKTVPIMNLNFPQSDAQLNTSSFDFNFTVFDNVDTSLQCNLTLDGTINNTVAINAVNGTPAEHSVSGLLDGVHYWNVTCWDSANNLNTSITLNFTVGEPPSIILTSPGNSTWFSISNVTFYYNVSDNVGVANCSLIFDGKINQTNSSIQNGSSNNFTVTNIQDGVYNWSINCSDEANLIGSSEQRTLYIDTVPPVPYILTIDGANFSDSTPQIEFNITDNVSQTINYTFIIDYTILSTNGTVLRDQLSYANLTNLIDGYYNVTLLAVDNAGNEKNSSTIQIYIDATPPTITIENPSVNEILGFTIYLETTISDAGIGLDQAWYYLYNSSGYMYQNGSLNASDNFNATWNSRDDIDDSRDTNYVYFNITANDTLGNTISIVVIFIVDNKNPSITFNFPDGSYVNDNFNLNILVQNDHLNISFYNITNSSGNLKYNNSNLSIGQPSFTWTDLINISNTTLYPEGIYNITVYANDSVGNNRTSYNYFIIDRTLPNITLLAPIDGYNSSVDSIEFNFTVSDNFDTNLTCNITINGTVKDIEFDAPNGSVTNRTISSLNQGSQFWNITCWDDAGNINISSTRLLTVDTSSPFIALIEPLDYYWNDTGNITFYYIPNDEYTNVENCSLIINGMINQTNSSIIEGTQNNFTVNNFNEAIYNWTVNCTDTVGNVGTNATLRTLYIDWSSPTVNITTNNKTWFNDPTPEIFFNITDNVDSLLNYTFYIDYATQSTNGTAFSRIISSDNLTSLQNGTYIIILEAWDELNAKVNSSPITIYIDTVQPIITLLAPANDSNTSQDVEFNFTVTDNMDTSLICNLTIDSIVNKANIESANGSIVNITVTNIPLGYRNWSIICIDNATNVQTSITWYFNVTPPDLFINSTLIVFNNTNPIEGENITISATIRNIGFSDTNNVIVQFFDGSPSDNGVQINGNRTVNVAYGSSAIANITWTASLGFHAIWVLIDPYDDISEVNETNNNATSNITISSWHIIYGKSVGDLLITDLANRKVFSWYVANASSGNIFAADYDSSVTWSNLTAIGRNISGQAVTDDFEEIDTALASTNYSDSVNITYTSNSAPKNTASFIVFTKTIANVSVVNSTNTSNFITGILWDVSDDLNGQYNGTEDLVFITKINPNAQGAYGTYDFEIRVPSELKKYKQTNLYSVAFYIELR